MSSRGPGTSVCFSPDGRILALAHGEADIHLWNVPADGREPQRRGTLHGHEQAACCLSFSPRDQTLASGGGDGTIRLWDVWTGRQRSVLRGHEGQVISVCFRSDGGLLASAGNDGTVRLWDPDTGRERTRFKGPEGVFCGVSFSPDGLVLATAGEDRTVRLWDLTGEGKPIKALYGHAGAVMGVCFSPDGKTLASASKDGTVRLWDARNGQERTVLRVQGDKGAVLAVCFSPDSRMLATAGEDRTVRLWRPWAGQEPTAAELLQELDDTIARQPDNPALRLRRALLLLRLGRTNEARASLSRAETLAPDDPALALTRYLLEARAREQAIAKAGSPPALTTERGWDGRTSPDGPRPRAHTDLLPVLEQELTTRRGERVREAVAVVGGVGWGGPWSALARLTTMSDRREDSLPGLCGLVRCAQGDWLTALPHLDAALALDAADRTARRARARVHAELGMWEQSAADCEICLKAEPERGELWLLRATARRHLKKLDEALADYAESLSRGDDGLGLRRERAGVYAELGRWEQAVADYTAILQRQPDDLAALIGRARALSARGQTREAEADYARATTRAPDDLALRAELGEFHLRHKQWDRAADVFASLAAREPGRRESIVNSYAQAGVRGRAGDFYARLTRLLPANQDVRIDSARLAAQVSRWPEAAADFARLFERDKNPVGDLCFERSAVCLLAGEDAYRQVRGMLLERGEKKDSKIRPFFVARGWALAPLSEAEGRRVSQVADGELKSAGRQSWSLRQLAALEARAGHFDRSEPLLRDCTQNFANYEDVIVARLWLALVLHGQGKTDEARKEFATATAVMDGWGKEMPDPAVKRPGFVGSLHLHDWLEAQVLRRELEKKLKKGD
jgi:tetratricopeptide (TPR) repeat protein